jgi:hypothetical protein
VRKTSVGREPLFRASKAKESSLLEAVARERLVKTAGWRRLSGCCGDLSILEISGDAVIAYNRISGQ